MDIHMDMDASNENSFMRLAWQEKYDIKKSFFKKEIELV